MAAYRYRALQDNGTVVEGSVDAGSRQEACRQLDNRNLIPLSLKTEEEGQEAAKRFSLAFLKRRKVSHRSLQDFTHLLSNLLSAGVSLSRALQLLAKEASTPVAREEWTKLRDLVVDGWSLADAMGRSPETFAGVYVAMVRAGETGGFLDVVLEQIADLQGRERELRSRVLSALIYPAVLLTLAVGVLIFLLTFFIPKFETIFAGFNAALPLLTRIIVAASAMTQRYGIVVVAAVVAAIIASPQWLAAEHGRRTWHRLILKVPVIGPLQARFAMARFCRMLGTLASSGVPLINGLRVAKESIGNQVLTDAVDAAILRVQKGDGLAASLKDCPELFPSSVLEMVAVAEETGRLDKELLRVAAASEKDLDRRLRTAVSLAEPLVLFLIAGLIGVIFIGMVVPIFSLQDYIQ